MFYAAVIMVLTSIKAPFLHPSIIGDEMQQKRLSGEYARILMDLKRLGLSNVEIAQKLGFTEGAVPVPDNGVSLVRRTGGRVNIPSCITTTG
jgi:hypothetical protein